MKTLLVALVLFFGQSKPGNDGKSLNRSRDIDRKEAEELISFGASYEVQSPQIQRIVSCRLEGKSCEDKLFSTLQRCNSLEELNLIECNIDGDGIRKICNQRIKALRIINCKISSSSIESVLSAKGLRYLDLSGSIPDGMILNKPINQTITHLVLSNNNLSSSFLLNSFHDKINYLDLGFCDFENKSDLSNIKKIDSIKTLILNGVNLDTEKFGFDDLSDTKLESLDLSHCNLSNSSISKLKLLSALKHLDISSNGLDDSNFKEITDLKNLVYLNVSKNYVTSKGINSISSLNDLTTIVAYGTGVDELFFAKDIIRKINDKSLRIISGDEN
jgi:uncharacterized protein YjbI with pentapeptide repeats